MWTAACRRNEIIGDFAEGVVRERYVLLNPPLLPEHFESFVRATSMWHDELTTLASSTRQRLRSACSRAVVTSW